MSPDEPSPADDETDADDPTDTDNPTAADDATVTAEGSPDADAGRSGRLDGATDRAVESFDQGVVDLLSWILDTETRAKIYVYLRANPGSTSEEIAGGTGLYPSTVREALAELHDEEKVTRTKRASEGAGNNPFEYRAIPPSALVSGVIDQVQTELNTIINLDRLLGRSGEESDEPSDDPVTITVDPDHEGSTSEGDERADTGGTLGSTDDRGSAN